MKRVQSQVSAAAVAFLIVSVAASLLNPIQLARAASTRTPQPSTGRSAIRQATEIYSSTSSSRSSYDLGAVGLGQAIRRLGMVASVLHTGAHPDDEDSGLLAYLARGRQIRTAYLSLTRGDGGQNLIGAELYESLGVIRTDEMLAARRIDAAEQFFTRAYDFGFSKSRDEALSKWNKDAVLADMVRVIRTFRPTIIISRFSGTPRDGHGHHQAAGYLTIEAHQAAADPSRYPDQIAGGLRPWKASKLYVSVFERRQQQRVEEEQPPTIIINTGAFDHLLGRSYYEIAMQGRSKHRSQDQGAIERRGPQYSRLRLIESSVGTAETESDILERLDSTLEGIAEGTKQSPPRLKEALAAAHRASVRAKQEFDAYNPGGVGPTISEGLRRIREARTLVRGSGLGAAERNEADFLIGHKERDFADALVKSRGAVIDCLTDDAVVAPGQTFKAAVSVYADAGVNATSISLVQPDDWSNSREKESGAIADGRAWWQTEFAVTVGANADVTEPYWLKNPRAHDMFQPAGGTGIAPHAGPVLLARVALELDGSSVVVEQPAEFRYADKALGEIRNELKIAPLVSLNISPHLLVFPVAAPAEREVTVSVTNNSKTEVSGSVALSAGDWVATPAETAFTLKREGENMSFTFRVSAPRQVVESSRTINAVASVGARQYRSGYTVVSYPHIEPRFVYSVASTKVLALDVKVAPGLRIGFIEGAGDDFANALGRLGVDVTMIGPRELAVGDLSSYDAIVTGVRVYEVRPDVIRNNARLLDYVRQGGTLIVQYNKSEYATESLAPYRIKMGQPADRVTDETARVTVLQPGHARFNFPNRITARDFDGWVQERGAYFLAEWSPEFTPLMGAGDPGEGLKPGGELIARYGKGLYVYSAYAWFRQLPSGVPGAYRLIANLVSLPKA